MKRKATFKKGRRWYRECRDCGGVKRLDKFPTKGKEGYGYLCRECRAAYSNKWYHRRAADLAWRANRANQQKDWAARNRDKVNERARRYRKKLYADPQRHAVYLEDRRIEIRLRREQEGRALTRNNVVAVRASEEVPLLPAKPLYSAARKYVENYVADGGTVAEACKMLGTTDREYRRWINKEQTRVRWDTADRLLTNLNLHWWDVWEKEEVPEKIAV